MKLWKLASVATALVLSSSVNASVLNTLNGVNYEWLEFSETAGLSRDAVELRLLDVNDVLYGYEYASRQLIEDLFLSYTTWDGLIGFHGAPDAVSGVSSLFNDFGATETFSGTGIIKNSTTVDGYEVQYESNAFTRSYGLYGASGECGINNSCVALLESYYNTSGQATLTRISGQQGWDATNTFVSTLDSSVPRTLAASYLVQTAVVPVPAAVWLFGSGLFGLIGFARRKKA